MAMARLLYDLSQKHHWPLQLTVAHCDHRVRPDSQETAQHVRRFAAALKLPFMLAVADREQGHWPEVGQQGGQHKVSV